MTKSSDWLAVRPSVALLLVYNGYTIEFNHQLELTMTNQTGK